MVVPCWGSQDTISPELPEGVEEEETKVPWEAPPVGREKMLAALKPLVKSCAMHACLHHACMHKRF